MFCPAGSLCDIAQFAIFSWHLSVGRQPERHCDGGPILFVRLNPMTEAHMQYLLMIYTQENHWNQMSDSDRQQGVAAYQAYTEALNKAGALVGANRLQHTDAATTVRLIDGKPQVLDGPYSDSKEQLAGYYLIEVPNLDAAIAWASRCPGAAHGIMEVRPVWTAPYEGRSGA
jgi:hypothetical protein